MQGRAQMIMAGFVALAAALGCGNSATAPNPASFEGNWTGTKLEYVSTANPATRTDLVANGATVTLNFDATHGYTLTVKQSGQPDEVTIGTWSATSDVMTMTVNGMNGELQFDMRLTATTLTLTGANASYDVNDDGIMEEAKMNMSFSR